MGKKKEPVKYVPYNGKKAIITKQLLRSQDVGFTREKYNC